MESKFQTIEVPQKKDRCYKDCCFFFYEFFHFTKTAMQNCTQNTKSAKQCGVTQFTSK